MSASQVSKSSVAQGNPKGSKAWDQTSSTAFAAELLLVGGGGGGSGDGEGWIMYVSYNARMQTRRDT